MTDVVAHRRNWPELLESAAAAGASWVEVDAAVGRTGDLVASHDAGGAGTPLSELLQLAASRGLRVTVDLKCPRAVVRSVCEAIAEAGLGDRVLFSGHYERPWEEISALLPDALLGWSPPEPGRWERNFRRRALQRELAAAAPALLGARGLDALLAHHSLVSEPLVRALHADGRLLHAWTVNRAGRARRLARMGVDAIVTDRPREIAAGLSSS